MDRTPSDLRGGDPYAYFVCPLKSCSKHMSGEILLSELWQHCADRAYRVALYAQDHYMCEVGCTVGFANMVHRLDHYAVMKHQPSA
jgi:hypothetical protein